MEILVHLFIKLKYKLLNSIHSILLCYMALYLPFPIKQSFVGLLMTNLSYFESWQGIGNLHLIGHFMQNLIARSRGFVL